MKLRFQCTTHEQVNVNLQRLVEILKDDYFYLNESYNSVDEARNYPIMVKSGIPNLHVGTVEFSQRVVPNGNGFVQFFDGCLEVDDKLLDFSIIDNDDNNNFEKFKFKLMKFFLRENGVKYFSRIVVYEDFQAKKISEALFSLVYELENKFREILDSVLSRELGPDWLRKYDVAYSLNKKQGAFKQDITDYSFVDARLLGLLTDQLLELIEPAKYTIGSKANDSQFVKDQLSKMVSALLDKTSTADKVVQLLVEGGLIEKDSGFSLHEEYFKILDIDGGDRRFKNRWGQATSYRNHIAHTKLLDIKFYLKSSNLFDSLIMSMDEFLRNRDVVTKERAVYFIDASAHLPEESTTIVDNTNDNEVVWDLTPEEIEVLDDEFTKQKEEEYKLMAQMEAGVNVRERPAILTIFMDAINSNIDELYNVLDLNDAEIVLNNSFSDDPSGIILIQAQHKYLKDKHYTIRVAEVSINDEQSSESFVKLLAESQDSEKEILVTYINGGYQLDPESNIFMPVTEDELYTNLLEHYVDEMTSNPNEMIPNYLEMIKEDSKNYIRGTEGEPDLLIEGECPYCGDYGTVTTEESYFEMMDKSQEPGDGICLKCGAICTVGENAQGYIKIVPYEDDPYYADLIDKDD